MIYGFTAISLAFGPTYLWHTVFKNNQKLDEVGYKFASYSSFYVWTPVAIISTIHLIKQTPFVDSFLVYSIKFSILGPWFFNIMAVYMMMFNSR